MCTEFQRVEDRTQNRNKESRALFTLLPANLVCGALSKAKETNNASALSSSPFGRFVCLC
jgi:hypothetical protein